ncbi:carbohydrate binding domain-containing protein [Thermotoga sp.]|uniref:carbohydrate binding domain-containing protein n=1 Tax=Thermotoga sp. TaxID=28240 RepID=UPI0025FD2402|nr:carbohydrate binding domain-containing protein [Thermotoga sp.]MCD6551443.1 carbohydrate binding domain-containing protein [Thermotoga sp.]
MRKAVFAWVVVLLVALVVAITGCVQQSAGQPVNKVLKVETGDQSWKTAWYYDIEDYITQDATYTFSIEIYHEEDATVTFQLTLKTTDEQYKAIILQDVPPATWTELVSEPYMIPGKPDDIYIEAKDTPNITFFFDNFVIKDESGNVVLKTDFESGETEGWQGNNATITVVSDPAQD